MNHLDTEIRRAIGELANAAPPMREPDSFRREFDDGPTTTESGTSRWLLAAAAKVVVGLVGVVLVVATSDDTPTAIAPAPDTAGPATGVPTGALAGDALLDELSGRRWVALERFDDPSPTARTPEFTVTSSSGAPFVDGFDGCNTYGGTFQLDDATVEGGEIASTTVGCDVETLGFGGTIELVPDAGTLLLSDLDGSPLARFHDLAQLPPASADDMPYTFFGDDLDSVAFGFLGDGRAGCTRIGWEESTDGVRIELLEILDGCSFEDGPLGGWPRSSSRILTVSRSPPVRSSASSRASAPVPTTCSTRSSPGSASPMPTRAGCRPSTDRTGNRGRGRGRRSAGGDPRLHTGQRRLTHARWPLSGDRWHGRRLRRRVLLVLSPPPQPHR